jgi:hypothetical protein
MKDSVSKGPRPVEVQRPDRTDSEESGNRTMPDIPLEMAKAGIGRAVKHAIGDEPLRVYGDDSMMAKVITGEKVPDYLARIYKNPEARRRYAVSLLRGDKKVRVRTVVEIEEETGT